MALGLLVLAIALGVGRALKQRQARNDAASAAAVAAQQAPVYQLSPQEVAVVQQLALAQSVAVSGSLKALQTAAIKARAAGEVQGLSKREGDAVKAGEVLARIDSTEATARVRQAEEQARAAQAQVAIAQRNFDNNQKLVQQGFISATALDTTAGNLSAAVVPVLFGAMGFFAGIAGPSRDLLVKKARALICGDPREETTFIGPMIDDSFTAWPHRP